MLAESGASNHRQIAILLPKPISLCLLRPTHSFLHWVRESRPLSLTYEVVIAFESKQRHLSLSSRTWSTYKVTIN